MSEPRVVDAAEAGEMSRMEALRVLATADGVPEKDRRIAQLMLAGPSIAPADQHLASPAYTKRLALGGFVAKALHQMAAQQKLERSQAETELLELSGMRRG